jgi:hypothetical protein
MLSVKFYTKNLVENHKNGHQEKENNLSNRIVKNGQKFVEIILLIIPTDMKTIFPHKNQTVKLRIKRTGKRTRFNFEIYLRAFGKEIINKYSTAKFHQEKRYHIYRSDPEVP